MFCTPRYAVNRNSFTNKSMQTHANGNRLQLKWIYRKQSDALAQHHHHDHHDHHYRGSPVTINVAAAFEYMVIIRVNELTVSIWRFYGSRFRFISCQYRLHVPAVPVPKLIAMWLQLHYSLCYLHNVSPTIRLLINWMTVLARRKRNG